MKRKKILRSIVLASCSAVCCFAAGLTLSACDASGGVQFVEEEKKKGPQFLEGSLADIFVGDTVVLTEYVEYVKEKYSLTVTDSEGNTQDLTNEVIWCPEAPGKYVMTYQVSSGKQKGTSVFEFNVCYPELTWEFSLQNRPYLYGETLIFENYFSDMNIYASLENWEVQMESVEVDGEEINLLEEESYTFQSMSDHTFKFFIESSDGQRCEGREVISMKYINEEYMQELTNMGISVYGDLYVEDGNYTMIAGNYCNGNNVWLRRENGPHNLPYVAYNGDYGIGDFVKVDFTGKNMPTLSFFRDEYTKSIFDGTKGVVYTGGFTDNNGDPINPTKNNDVTLYGPYMLHEYDRGAADTTTIADSPAPPSTENDVFPGSFNSLDEDTHYRMIAGFSGVEKGVAGLLNSNPAQYVDTLFLTFKCIILNLDTFEIVSEITMRTYGMQALGFLEIPLDTENNEFFTGNIVMYGQHGRRTKLDKIYPIITGKSFEEIYTTEIVRAEFKDTAKTFVLLNSEINVSDYVDTTKTGYKFFYRDQAGVEYPVTGDKFTIAQEGRYTLYYKYDNLYYGTFEIFVGDLKYKTTMDENGKIVLGEGSIGNGGTYNGPNPNNLIDQAYIAFTGEYSFNDYVAMDFTGKNMPEIAFFANDFDNSMYAGKGGKEGVVVASGITLWDGSTSAWTGNNGTQVLVSGPYMANYNAAEKDTSGNLLNAFDSKLARENLQDGVRYRVIIGFEESQADSRAIVLKYALYNLDTNELVEEVSQVSWNMFSNPDYYEQDRSTLCGSIILYGKFKTTTTIDKFWGIYEDTTIADVKAAIEVE